jgi:hypothetical protein
MNKAIVLGEDTQLNIFSQELQKSSLKKKVQNEPEGILAGSNNNNTPQ